MTPALDITTEQRKKLLTLLCRFIPGILVWAYGSRVKWTARPNSDLDLVVFATPEQRQQVSRLKDALAESNLPFVVDVHVWDEVPERFHAIIRKEYVVLQAAEEERVGVGKTGEWEIARLGDKIEINPPRELRRGEESVYVAMDDLTLWNREVSRWARREYSGSGSRFRNGDTLLARITPCLENGKTAFLRFLPEAEVAHGSTEFIVLAGRHGTSDDLFVYYLARSEPFREFAIQRMEGSSGRQRVSAPAIAGFEFELPPLPEQRAIAGVLGALDDKIELNRRMNETLEAIAKAEFRRMMEEGGKKGWRVEKLGDLIELAYGDALKEENRRPGSIPVFRSNGQIGWHDQTLVKGPGIVVGRKGNPGIVTWSHTDFFPIDTTFYVVPKGECRSLYFLFYALSEQGLQSLGADSAVPGLNRNMAYLSEQIVPSPAALAQFDKVVAPLYARIHANDEQSRTLAGLRDALLPKLLSGTVRVRPERMKAEG